LMGQPEEFEVLYNLHIPLLTPSLNALYCIIVLKCDKSESYIF
jgi:hypothetical protein